MSELRSRIKTASILLPIFVAGVLWAPSWLLAALLAAVVLLGAWEWTALSGMRAGFGRVMFVIVTAVLMSMIYWQLVHRAETATGAMAWLTGLLAISLVWWAFALIAIVRYQSGGQLVWPGGPGGIVLGWVIVLPPWIGLIVLHSQFGPGWVLVLLCVVWVADVGAYFCGRRYGKHTLASRVSPGKTVEGIVGALLIGCLVGLVGIATLDWRPAWWVMVVVVGTVLMSVLGDLVESVMKRRAGVKDSGTLLPGHGGVLDRIDSLTAAVPFFVVFAGSLGRTL